MQLTSDIWKPVLPWDKFTADPICVFMGSIKYSHGSKEIRSNNKRENCTTANDNDSDIDFIPKSDP
jgi:hypothetical protein